MRKNRAALSPIQLAAYREQRLADHDRKNERFERHLPALAMIATLAWGFIAGFIVGKVYF